MPVTLNVIETETTLETTVVEIVLESASEPGPAGPGVAVGGTTGQVLVKASDTDYDTEWDDAGAPGLHATTHENSGSDEISVAGLSGLLADAQTPLTHAHAGEDITSGTVADARIASTIARDSEVTSAISTSEAGQVRDGDSAGGVLNGTYPNPGFAADMATQAELDAHTGDTSDAHDASAISFTPAGSIAATDVQAAIEEVASEAGGGGGAPADADYLVGTANGTLSAEIVVGTSPGGELGGTWASPTVDATHSGSSHAAVQAAAEATAAAALAGHTGDTSDAHDASAISVDSTSLSGTGTDVQASLEELDNLLDDHSGRHENGGADEISIAGLDGTPTALQTHLDDTSDAHDASAISIADAGNDFTATDVEGALAELQADHEADATALSDHIADSSAAHAASAVSVSSATLSGTGTDVQAVFEEIDNLLDDHSARHENGGADEISIAGLDGTPTELTNHLNDTSDAHDASAISFSATGGISATDVQAAIAEVDSEKTTAAAALTAAQTEIADQKRVAVIAVSDPNGDAITTGDGKAYFPVPNIMNGHNLVDADAAVTTVSSSGTPTIQVHNLTQTADMLSTRITIDANENTSYSAAAAPVIDTGNDDVATGDLLRIDIDVAGTGTKGLFVILTFEAP